MFKFVYNYYITLLVTCDWMEANSQLLWKQCKLTHHFYGENGISFRIRSCWNFVVAAMGLTNVLCSYYHLDRYYLLPDLKHDLVHRAVYSQ